jgi:hypothetical protein
LGRTSVAGQERPRRYRRLLAAIDLVYVPAGRISKMYLLDAVAELGWILARRRAELPGG